MGLINVLKESMRAMDSERESSVEGLLARIERETFSVESDDSVSSDVSLPLTSSSSFISPSLPHPMPSSLHMSLSMSSSASSDLTPLSKKMNLNRTNRSLSFSPSRTAPLSLSFPQASPSVSSSPSKDAKKFEGFERDSNAKHIKVIFALFLPHSHSPPPHSLSPSLLLYQTYLDNLCKVDDERLKEEKEREERELATRDIFTFLTSVSGNSEDFLVFHYFKYFIISNAKIKSYYYKYCENSFFHFTNSFLYLLLRYRSHNK